MGERWVTAAERLSDFRPMLEDFTVAFADVPRWRGRSGFQGRNFMTPDVLSILSAGGVPVEVSTGMGFTGDRLFGFTVARSGDPRSRCVVGARSMADVRVAWDALRLELEQEGGE